MIPAKLFRWSGMALVGAGLLIALGFLLHPDISQPHAAEQARWVPAHVVLIASLLLTLFGMIGMFLWQAERSGWLGLGGFVLLLSGIVLTTVAIVADAFIFPPIEASAAGATLTDPAGPLLNGPLGLVLMGATITFALGSIALGIATLRAQVFSRWPALLLIVGGPLLAADPLLPQVVVLLGAGMTSASLLWFGLALLGRPARSPSVERAALSH